MYYDLNETSSVGEFLPIMSLRQCGPTNLHEIQKKFSKVSPHLNVLCEITILLTFEKFSQ